MQCEGTKYQLEFSEVLQQAYMYSLPAHMLTRLLDERYNAEET